MFSAEAGSENDALPFEDAVISIALCESVQHPFSRARAMFSAANFVAFSPHTFSMRPDDMNE